MYHSAPMAYNTGKFVCNISLFNLFSYIFIYLCIIYIFIIYVFIHLFIKGRRRGKENVQYDMMRTADPHILLNCSEMQR